MRILGVLRVRTWGGSSRTLANVLGHWAESHEVWLATTEDEPQENAHTFDPRIRVVSLGRPASTAMRIRTQVPVVRALS